MYFNKNIVQEIEYTDKYHYVLLSPGLTVNQTKMVYTSTHK